MADAELLSFLPIDGLPILARGNTVYTAIDAFETIVSVGEVILQCKLVVDAKSENVCPGMIRQCCLGIRNGRQ